MAKSKEVFASLVKRHNQGEIFLLNSNLRTKDQFLNMIIDGKLFSNENKTKFFIVESCDNSGYDFDLINNAIELEGDEKIANDIDDIPLDKIGSTTTYGVLFEYTKTEILNYLKQEIKEDMDAFMEIIEGKL